MTAIAALAALAASPAAASRPETVDPARTYVAARAAALSGDHARSAQLLAQLVESRTASPETVREAISEAIGTGAMALALRLSANAPADTLPVEARLLLIGEEMRKGKPVSAAALLSGDSDLGNVNFLSPLVGAWIAADRRDLKGALAQLDSITKGNPLIAVVPEFRALILLKFRRIAEAQPYVARAIETAGGREQRLRLAFADAYLAAGDRQRALAMIEGSDPAEVEARARIGAGKPTGQAIDTAAKGYSELLLRLAIDLNRLGNNSLPVALAQIARYVAPDNSSAPILVGIFLDDRGRTDAALNAFASVAERDLLASQALDARVRALVDSDRIGEGLALAEAASASRGANSGDFARLGDVLEASRRYDEAAAAYGRALQLSANAPADDRWPLLLLQASALESAGRWPESRQALGAALALAPDEPLILNFLGYAKLERGEDLDSAEAMIRRASALAPNDPSITDSLGWALYKRGRVDQAIEALQQAARRDPMQAEIHEHLGDALYTAGRRFEARFAWQAALATAEKDVAARIRSKIETGLSDETAAP